MVVDNILASLNKELDRATNLKDTDDILKIWDIHFKLLQGVEKLQLLIESGVIDKDKQVVLDEVRAIAHFIKPTDMLDFYN